MDPNNRPLYPVPPSRKPAQNSDRPSADEYATDPAVSRPAARQPVASTRPKAPVRRNLYRMKQSRNTDRSMYPYLGALVFVVLALRYGQPLMFGPSIDQQLSDEAYTANQSLPKMIDAVTRLDHVESSPGKHLRFINTIVGIPDEQVIASKIEIIADIRANAKQRNVEKFTAMGVKYTYVFKNEAGKTLIEFDL